MYTDFGENLRKLRKSQHLTQEQLGNKCNISATAVSKYESGAVKPSLEVAISIAGYLNVSLDTLFSTQPKDTLSLQGLTGEQSEILKKLAEQFHTQNIVKRKKLTEEQYEIIGRIVADFSKNV